jgi:hypothetical protein
VDLRERGWGGTDRCFLKDSAPCNWLLYLLNFIIIITLPFDDAGKIE